MRQCLAVLGAVGIAACGQPVVSGADGGLDGGSGTGSTGSLSIVAVSPSSGSVDGGTAVMVMGTGFSPGLTLSFGNRQALQIVVQGDTAITALTPPSATVGSVGVTVGLPSGSATLPNAFTYQGPPLTVAYCALHAPATLSALVGQAAGPLYGWIYVPGITDGSAQGAGISAQVGFGAPGSTPDASWQWADATFDGKAGPGNHNDEYNALLPVAAAPGAFDMAVRFSRDGRQTWTACDTAGDTPTAPYAPAKAGKLTVTVPPPASIGYCATHFPTSMSVNAGQTAGPVFGWVYAVGVTDGPGQGGGIAAQLGQGPTGTTPDARWAWMPAGFDAKQGPGGHDDEYTASLALQTDAGSFDYAFRFSLGDGGFVDCDTAGDPQYVPASAGHLTVSAPARPSISYCQLHFPTTANGVVAQPVGPIYGWVYVPGVTDRVGQGPGINGELGEGPLGTVPGSNPDSGWAFVPASYDADKDGLTQGDHANDEYQATLPAQPDAGVFAYAYRFEIDGGIGFVACDTLGDQNYAVANQGVLTVVQDGGPPLGIDAGIDAGSGPALVGYCSFQYPDLLLGEAYAASTPVVGVVFQAGVTPGVGEGHGIAGQAGVGPNGSTPSAPDAGWTWTAASYFADVDGLTPGDLANDAYAASLPFPDAGLYAMAYRFTLDDGGSYRYCDSAGDAVYSPASQATLSVVPAPLTVGWCDLQFPAATTAHAGQDAGPVFGQVYKQGVTDRAGQGPDILAQLGVGPPGADPTRSDGGFAWTAASYDGDRGNNDEYAAALVAPADAGSYAYYFRFSEDDGRVWTVCGFQSPLAVGGDAGVLTVQ